MISVSYKFQLRGHLQKPGPYVSNKARYILLLCVDDYTYPHQKWYSDLRCHKTGTVWVLMRQPKVTYYELDVSLVKRQLTRGVISNRGRPHHHTRSMKKS